MKIAFYKAEHGNWIDKVVSIATDSKYSHCELIFSDGEFLSSSKRDGGVRYMYINNTYKWDIFDIATTRSERLIRILAQPYINQKYDTIGAIGSAFNIDISNKNKKYCSQLCAILLGINKTTITPEELFKFLVNNNIIKK